MANVGSTNQNEVAKRRLSVSLSAEHYTRLVQLSSENKLSIAWVVRAAIERLLEEQRPLFESRCPK